VRFASIVESTVHVIHANDDRTAGLQVVGSAEAALSMQRVAFVTHVEPGKPGEVVARVIKRIRCDALFAGAHMELRQGRPRGAIAVLEWIRRQWRRARVLYVSDSAYVIKGMTEWVQGWEARGWKRQRGALENLELWQKLVQAAAAHEVAWHWVEGHAGHAKNEYANYLATRAAERQERSDGLLASGFDAWLARHRAAGRSPGSRWAPWSRTRRSKTCSRSGTTATRAACPTAATPPCRATAAVSTRR